MSAGILPALMFAGFQPAELKAPRDAGVTNN
jgi:hypothetical protein